MLSSASRASLSSSSAIMDLDETESCDCWSWMPLSPLEMGEIGTVESFSMASIGGGVERVADENRI